MPLDDRDYMRGRHPPACTCVSCVARRRRQGEGGQNRSGASLLRSRSRPQSSGMSGDGPAAAAKKSGGSKGGFLRKLLTWAVVVFLLWAGWGVWQDYREHNYFEPGRAVDVALGQWAKIPGLARDLPGLLNRTMAGARSWLYAELHPDEAWAADPDRIEETALLVHRLVNEAREQRGLRTLAYDKKLAVVAQAHSEDMAALDYFSHTNPAGEGPTDRGRRLGYFCHKDYGVYYADGLAENIYQGWFGYSLEGIAADVVDGWLDSPGHRENLLDRNYDREGIGISVASDKKMYFTQVFC